MKQKNEYCMINSERTLPKADNVFHDCGPVYLFTNENIAGYVSALGDMHGARVLTVCASGDHAFESYLAGASCVDTFDINSSQRSVYELKSLLIKNFEYEDFMSFFFEPRYFFHKSMLKSIRGQCSDNLKVFLDRYKRVGSGLFRNRAPHASSVDIFKLSYIQDVAKYNQLRECLADKRVSFTHCSLDDLTTKFQARYDVIMLSNIADYLYELVSTGEVVLWHLYGDYLIDMANKILSYDNGRIVFQYMWCANPGYCRAFVHKYQEQLAHREHNNRHHSFAAPSFGGIERGTDTDAAFIMFQNQKTK